MSYHIKTCQSYTSELRICFTLTRIDSPLRSGAFYYHYFFTECSQSYWVSLTHCGPGENRTHHTLRAKENRLALVHASPFFCCPGWIRTNTPRVKVEWTAIILQGNLISCGSGNRTHLVRAYETRQCTSSSFPQFIFLLINKDLNLNPAFLPVPRPTQFTVHHTP